jgi:hypothetical protein
LCRQICIWLHVALAVSVLRKTTSTERREASTAAIIGGPYQNNGQAHNGIGCCDQALDRLLALVLTMRSRNADKGYRKMRAFGVAAIALVLVFLVTTGAVAQQSTEDLAKASQNPVAAMISVPFQNNTNFDVGPFGRTQDVLNIQPVIPITLNPDWNLISRTIVPLIDQPKPREDSSLFGVGDINETLFLSPAHPGSVIWGVGPTVTAPSATNMILGTGKWLAGPSVVALVTPGHWVIGALVSNQWSFAGDGDRPSVNTGLIQPFINYNLPRGWYLTSSPIITVNWNAGSGQQWTVPVGGGIGRVFKVGGQAFNAQVAGYYNALHPDQAGNWQLRFQLSLLFPRR